MRVLLIILLIALTVLLTARSPLYAEETIVKTGGYLRNFFIVTDSGDDSNLEALARLRLRLYITQSESATWEFAYEVAPHFREQNNGSAFASLPRPAPLSYRAFDLDERLYPENDKPEGDFVLSQNLDRALLTLTTPSLDLYIGRQPVAFGSARVINPTDIIAPFTFDTLAKEERLGVDAVRLKTPVGEMGELDMGLVFGEDFKPGKSAAFLRSKLYLLKTDVSLMAMVFRENILFGIDMARSIGGAGAWLEAAYTLAGGAADYKQEENYFRLSAGSDYSFTEKLYAYMEYHYNGAGTGKPENYFSAISETAYTDGAVYLLGRHYMVPGITYQLTPLLIFKAQALVNMNDGSALASPGFEYNLAHDVYVELGAYLGIGEKTTDQSLPESEFGLYPDVYYAALNIYF